MSSQKKSEFTAVENIMLKDPIMRASRNTDVFIEAVRLLNSGALVWNPVAFVSLISTVRKSAIIERLLKFERDTKLIHKYAKFVPNIKRTGYEIADFDEIEEEITDEGSEEVEKENESESEKE